jgi:GTP-binding protein
MVDHQFYLVDAPGFGYTAYGKQDLERFAELMQPYFVEAKPRLALYLMDSRRDVLESDIQWIRELNRQMNVLLVFTKIDVLNQKEQAALIKQLKTLGLSNEEFAFVSQENQRLVEKLRDLIRSFFPNTKIETP